MNDAMISLDPSVATCISHQMFLFSIQYLGNLNNIYDIYIKETKLFFWVQHLALKTHIGYRTHNKKKPLSTARYLNVQPGRFEIILAI